MNHLLFIGNLGAGEIIVIALIVLLLFGGKKNPGTDERSRQGCAQLQGRHEQHRERHRKLGYGKIQQRK